MCWILIYIDGLYDQIILFVQVSSGLVCWLHFSKMNAANNSHHMEFWKRCKYWHICCAFDIFHAS